MKFIFKIVLLLLLLLSMNSIAMAVEIQGEVVGTAGLDVTVKTVGEKIPVSGDLMEISFSIPGGESLSVGIWKVTGVSGRIVSASVVENTGTPSKGQQAVITSNNPASIKTVSKPKKKSSYSPPVITGQLSSEAREVVSLLRSSTATDIRNGAKKAYRNFAKDASVMAVVADVLSQGYANNSRDGYHVDAMSWLCNALGASKDGQYKEILETVYRKSPSQKIRKYANKNLRILR